MLKEISKAYRRYKRFRNGIKGSGVVYIPTRDYGDPLSEELIESMFKGEYKRPFVDGHVSIVYLTHTLISEVVQYSFYEKSKRKIYYPLLYLMLRYLPKIGL